MGGRDVQSVLDCGCNGKVLTKDSLSLWIQVNGI
nr:MAG TPA: hypothetical protein [Caudoviricetes sp.]